jgi:hypothetical protein
VQESGWSLGSNFLASLFCAGNTVDITIRHMIHYNRYHIVEYIFVLEAISGDYVPAKCKHCTRSPVELIHRKHPQSGVRFCSYQASRAIKQEERHLVGI